MFEQLCIHWEKTIDSNENLISSLERCLDLKIMDTILFDRKNSHDKFKPVKWIFTDL